MSATFDKPYEEKRPWGSFVQYTHDEPSTVKILIVEPGQAFSLQYHHHRDEFWLVLSGNGTIRIGDENKPAIPGESHLISRTVLHRITAGTEAVKVLEISTGEFDEADIVRIEDNYGRLT